MGEEKGRACGIHAGGMLNRDESRRGRRFVGWREKKERKKKGKKHSLHAREFIIDARLFRTATTHGSLVEIRHTRAALLIKNYRPSNS